MEESGTKQLRLGLFIRQCRKEEGLSLTELARRADISRGCLQRLEKEGVPLEKAALGRLKETLGIPFHDDYVLLSTFKEQFDSLYHNILYREYFEAESQYDHLLRNRERYVKSDCFVDFHLIMFIATYRLKRSQQQTEPFYQTAKILSPTMDEWQKGLFNVEEAIYLYRTSRGEKSMDQLKECLRTLDDPHHLANAHITIGTIFHNDYRHYQEAVDHLEKALELYERHANFHRACRTKLLLQIIRIHQHNPLEVQSLHEDVTTFASRVGALELYYFAQLNMARFHLLEKRPEKALEILSRFRLEIAWYYILKIYAYHLLGRTVLALQTIEEYKKRPVKTYKPVERMFFGIMEKFYVKETDDHTLERLKDITDICLEKGDYLMFVITMEIYTGALEETRKYKEAYIYAEKMLDVLRRSRKKRRETI